MLIASLKMFQRLRNVVTIKFGFLALLTILILSSKIAVYYVKRAYITD